MSGGGEARKIMIGLPVRAALAVAGQENPIDTIYSNKFYEVAPYVTLTKHVYSPIPLAISEKTWQKLSAADRAAVT